ncbi:Protein of uncharacterised function (DUF2637) [Mycobacteroides abscessus subsp. abscessus]|nr:Protein of uncharacterised function (DUF2637) [Mycobacteroides abscessus subsp. abscessus]SLG10190.1 Protein of uncharacterised function (DUF2637) [Mycobacteroides abscessus subsp. abscessus]
MLSSSTIISSMSLMTTSAELAEAESDRQCARRFFWWWLGSATVLTLVGNTVHAVLPVISATAVKIGVNLIPPVIAFAAIHGLQALARAGSVHRARRGSFSLRESGGPYVFAVCVTALLALAAAILSYAGLYAVAVAGGLGPRLAALWPLTIDAGIAVSTISLMVLRPASGADLRAARTAARAVSTRSARETSTTAPQVNTPARGARTQPAQSSKTDTAPRSPGPLSAPAQTERAPQAARTALIAPDFAVTDAHRERAAKLVAEGITQKDAESVARVLALAESGASVTRIERETRVHRDAVKKILSAGSEVPMPVLAAV